MTRPVLTCDRLEGLIRAAVWEGGTLRDLYVDREKEPDMTGAVVRGKVVRVLSGQKAGWMDAGLVEKIYIEGHAPLRAGEEMACRIRTTMPDGKAWLGEACDLSLAPPPLPWQRAVADWGDLSLRFSSKEDFDLCGAARAVFSKEPVHPELDEMIEGLLEKRVSLSGGANIVIEQTEALVAIDVNAGEGGSPLAVNLLAVREAARQIRLRNLSGIILIDALKMKDRADTSKMLNALKRAVESDPAGVNVFGLTKLGLIEMTRTRRGRPLMGAMERGQ